MTDIGYRLASWMHKHMTNVLVVASYAALFILLVVAIGFWLQPDKEDVKREVQVTQDDAPIQRR
ncbi:hypothetical protein KQI65_06925 [bacterium]|nr:hypothetical protein [bacterium]